MPESGHGGTEVGTERRNVAGKPGAGALSGILAEGVLKANAI